MTVFHPGDHIALRNTANDKWEHAIVHEVFAATFCSCGGWVSPTNGCFADVLVDLADTSRVRPWAGAA
jgi:hypothetical protein